MEEEEFPPDHEPFGDTFRTRGDYSKGMMYMARRTYMDSESENSLRPPDLFLTRSQSIRRVFLSSNDKLSNIQNMAYFRDEQQQGAANNNKRKQMIKKKAIEKQIIIDKFSSTNPEDWEEEFIAGVHMWTNHRTGEVSEECPWAASTQDKQEFETSDIPEEGTGAPVYDGRELEDLFAYLDSHKSPTKTSTSTLSSA